MQVLANAPPNDLEALKQVEERSRALSNELDRMESLVEPMAKFAVALDRLALLSIGNAARTLLSLEPMLLGLQSIQAEISALQADEAGDTVLAAAETLKEQLQGLHRQISTVKGGSANSNVRELCDSVLLANKRMFDVTEEMRWAVMELQADADLGAGRVNNFSSAAELLQHLNRAQPTKLPNK